MKLIDKDALVAEIEKRQSIVLDPLNNNIHTKRLEETYKSILSFINTLEVKEVDLDEISRQYALNNTPWDDCVDEIQDAYKAGFELGLKTKRNNYDNRRIIK